MKIPSRDKSSPLKSYSPTVNYLLSELISESPNLSIFHCDEEDEINIADPDDDEHCVQWDSSEAQKVMLKNLKSKYFHPSRIIAPMQIKTNCWFNCFFMIFFISDKGKKFFRYLRKTMITGILPSGKKIPKDLHRVFFFLNKYIDCSIVGTK